MNSVTDKPQAKSGAPRTGFWRGFEKVFGKMGLTWAVGFTVAATALRWVTDAWLGNSAPFSFYYLSVVLTALVARFGSASLAVILGAVCGHFLWVDPRLSWQFTDASQVAQLVVYLMVGSLNALAVSAARTFRLLEDIERFEN